MQAQKEQSRAQQSKAMLNCPLRQTPISSSVEWKGGGMHWQSCQDVAWTDRAVVLPGPLQARLHDKQHACRSGKWTGDVAPDVVVLSRKDWNARGPCIDGIPWRLWTLFSCLCELSPASRFFERGSGWKIVKKGGLWPKLSFRLKCKAAPAKTVRPWQTVFGNTHTFGFIHFGVPIFHSANCSFLIHSKKHVASAALQTNEQECLDKRLAISYKSTELPILHEINQSKLGSRGDGHATKRILKSKFFWSAQTLPSYCTRRFLKFHHLLSICQTCVFTCKNLWHLNWKTAIFQKMVFQKKWHCRIEKKNYLELTKNIRKLNVTFNGALLIFFSKLWFQK